MAKLAHKLKIIGKLTVETGLHIGGSEVDLDIGGIDKEVVKVRTQNGDRIPFIPGSSLKGKLRNLLARHEGYKEIKDDRGVMLKLFGRPNGKNSKMVVSRLIVRDSYFEDEKEFQTNKSLEDKAENVINRATGEAKPRHIERVTRGSSFSLDMILDVYEHEDTDVQLLETLDLGFQLLQKDYLGGSGTRGYGKISVNEVEIQKLVFESNGTIDKSPKVDYTFKVNDEQP